MAGNGARDRVYTSGMLPRVAPPGGTQGSESPNARSSQALAPSPLGVYVCGSPSGVVSACNETMVEIWGQPPAPGEAHDRLWSRCHLLRADGTPLALSETPMFRGLRDGVATVEEILVERPDGSRLVARVETSPLHDADGRLVGAVNVVAGRPTGDALAIDESATGEPARDSIRTLEVLYRLVDRVAR